MENKEQKPYIFLIAGRTGGPLMPVLAIFSSLKDGYQPLLIGVKNGFEQKISQTRSYPIKNLPESKFTIFSFTNNDWYDWIKEYLLTAWNLVILVFSCFKSIYLAYHYKPKAVITAGGFLAVPIFVGFKITNLLGITHTKLILHQQDPLPSLSNKLLVKYADYATCVFDYTKENYKQFRECKQIPNPLETDQFSKEHYNNILSNLEKTQPNLHSFLVHLKPEKPLMVVFGGGGGAWAINRWMIQQHKEILKHFQVIHLTGVLQKDEFEDVTNSGYFQTTGLFEEMPLVLNLADLVVCRSGMSSITELTYLNKPAFLVPLPHSHQQINAEQVKDHFFILNQQIIKQRPGKEPWLEQILEQYPGFFKNINYPNSGKTKVALAKYYLEVKQTIERPLTNTKN